MLANVMALAILIRADPPARQDPPTKDELAAIAERGRNLAAYDDAAWRASDAIQARKPKEGSIQQYIARKTERGWVVAFGRPNPKGDRFLVSYEAAQQPGKPEEFDVKELNPPRDDDPFLLSASRAIDSALKDFVKNYKGEQRPYNVAVLPAEMGQFWVYLIPAQTKAGIWPLGGDVRYLMSADGAKVVAKRRLHNAIIENEPPKEGAEKLVMGMHTHVLDDAPEDTDVFHVLVRKPSVPETVITNRFVFQVEPDGSIAYKGKAEEVLKR